MDNLYSISPQDPKTEEDRKSINRLLKRLRVALFIWLFSFIATIVWFSVTR